MHFRILFLLLYNYLETKFMHINWILVGYINAILDSKDKQMDA